MPEIIGVDAIEAGYEDGRRDQGSQRIAVITVVIAQNADDIQPEGAERGGDDDNEIDQFCDAGDDFGRYRANAAPRGDRPR